MRRLFFDRARIRIIEPETARPHVPHIFVNRGVIDSLVDVQLVIVERFEVALDVVEQIFVANSVGRFFAVAVVLARVCKEFGDDAADEVPALVGVAMAGRARSEGQVNAHVRADVSHRGCRFKELVEVADPPEFSKKGGLIIIASGFGFANAFQHQGLRGRVRFDVSTTLRARFFAKRRAHWPRV